MSAMTLAELQVIINGNTKNYTKALQQAQQQTKAATTGINNTISKIGGIVAKALSVAAIVKFGDSCIYAGRKLNAMSSMSRKVFPSMQSEIQAWAKSATDSFGLSQKQALEYTSNLGSMAKAFGFTEKEAASMATTLAGRAGDVASFYSMDQDDAYKKMQSVFTGETESLKSLGIVMTQTALDQYAMANGFGKTTSQMSEQEKALLRYQFVLSQTSQAEGDFVDTSAAWGNQIKILRLHFEDFKAAIGQGLINVLSPVLKMINLVMTQLVKLAQVFKAFTELITGKTSSSSSSAADISALTDTADTGFSDAADSASKMADNVTDIGDAAEKSAKQMSGLMGFDEINKQSDASASSGSSGTGSPGQGGTGAAGGAIGNVDFGSLARGDTVVDEINGRLKKMLDWLKRIKGIVSRGFWNGFGGTSLKPLQDAVKGIQASLSKIVNNNDVRKAASQWVDTLAYSLGQQAGAVASIGVTAATNLVGGINLFLQQNTGRVIDWICSMFDISSEIHTIRGNLWAAVADIFSVFGSEIGQQLTANIIGIAADAFMGLTSLGGKFLRDIIGILFQPIIDNVEKIKTVLEGALLFLSGIAESIKGVVDSFVDHANAVYDEHIKPLADSLKNGISELLGKLMDGWTTYIQPVLNNLAAKFKDVCENYITPALDEVIGLVGDIADALKVLWENVLQPVTAWIIDNVYPVAAELLASFGESVLAAIQGLSDTIGMLAADLRELVQFIKNVFTGDWDAAWRNIKNIFDITTGGIKKIAEDIFGKEVVNDISGAWKKVKSGVISAWEGGKGIVSRLGSAFDSARDKAANAFGGENGIVSKISRAWDLIKDGTSEFKKSWKNSWNRIGSIVEETWNFIKTPINSLMSGIETMANGVVAGINRMISALNNLSFSIPDWVPGIGGNSFGFSIGYISEIELPRLATGGFPEDGLFMANHGEMLGKFSNGRNVVANNQQITAGIANAVGPAVYRAVLEALMQVDTRGGDTYILSPDVKKFFEIIRAEGKKYQMQTGREVFA